MKVLKVTLPDVTFKTRELDEDGKLVQLELTAREQLLRLVRFAPASAQGGGGFSVSDIQNRISLVEKLEAGAELSVLLETDELKTLKDAFSQARWGAVNKDVLRVSDSLDNPEETEVVEKSGEAGAVKPAQKASDDTRKEEL